MNEQIAPNEQPGFEWLEIIRRPSLEAFAKAFSEAVSLETSVTDRTVRGVADIHRFFDATRTMYDNIAFSKETTVPLRTYLEWEGAFSGQAIAGLTVLGRIEDGRIDSIRVYYRSFIAVSKFSDELERRLSSSLGHRPE